MTAKHPNVSIVIPTFNRPRSTVLRAVVGALEQNVAEVIVCCGHEITPFASTRFINTHSDDNATLNWYLGVRAAETEFVAICPDDDWYLPGFVDRCIDALRFDAGPGLCSPAYAACSSQVVSDAGATIPNLMLPYATVHKVAFEKYLLSLPMTLTPAACLLRRRDVLDFMSPCPVPGIAKRLKIGGPCPIDKVMLLMPLLRPEYDSVALVGKALVNLGGGEDSTTLRELAAGRERGLCELYDDANRYYLACKKLVDR